MDKIIKLTSVIDQQEAQKLHFSIVTDIDDIDNLEIDASVVERIGTSAIQLLIAVDVYFKDKKINFKLKGCSGAFEAAFVDLGFINIVKEWKAR